MRISKRPGMATIGTVVLLGALPGMANAAPLDSPPDCTSSYNPYAYTQSALAACNVVASSAPTVSSLPDGSTVYSYKLPQDGTVRLIDPPAGFDFTRAAPAELREYGLPQAPPSPDIRAVQAWDQLLSGLKTTPAAPPFLIQGTTTNGIQYSTNWSGYIVYPSFGVGSAQVTYTEPSVSSCASGSSASFWAGIGTSYVGQDGTAWGAGGNYAAWEEILPNQGSQVNLGFNVPAGHEVEAEVSWTPSSQSYGGFVEDLSTSTYQAWGYSGGTYAPNNTAEAIAERPSIGGSSTSLANFGAVSFLSAYAYSTTGSGQAFSAFSPSGARNGDYMVNSAGSALATPGAIGSGGAFTDRWNACS